MSQLQPLTVSELLLLNEEIRLALRSGVPLDLGLRESASHLPGRLSLLAQQLSTGVQQGKSLPDALEHLEPPVPVVYRVLVAAGLRGSQLESVLTRIDEFGRVLVDMRESLRRALIYPLSVLVVLYVVVSLTVWWGAPVLRSFLDDLQAEPSFPIRMIYQLYEWLPLWVIGCPVLVGVIAGVGLLRDWIDSGRIGSLGFLRMIPGLNSLRRSAEISQFAHLLAIQVEYGIPFPEALRRGADLLTDGRLRSCCLDAASRTEQGQSPSDMAAMPTFVRWILTVPTSQADLANNLRHAADLYRERTVLRAEWLTRAVPLALTLGLGTLSVGTYCWAVLDSLRVIWGKLS